MIPIIININIINNKKKCTLKNTQEFCEENYKTLVKYIKEHKLKGE